MALLTDEQVERDLGYGGTDRPATPLIADRAKLEAIVERPLPGELFEAIPWGNRIIVVRRSPLKVTQAGLHLPDSAVKAPSRGWVVSVGHTVGLGSAGAVGWCPFPREYLPGTEIMFGLYAGKAIKVNDEEDDLETSYVLMTDNDVWFQIGPHPGEPIATQANMGEPNQ